MKNKSSILYILIIFFTFIMPLIPSSFHYKFINLSGDILLYLIIIFFMMMLIFDKSFRNDTFKSLKLFFNDYLNVFMLIWVITMFVSVIYSRDKLLALMESIRLSSYVFLFFILKYYINEEKIYKYILKSYMLTSIIIGIYGIYQNFMGIGLKINTKFGSEIRVSAFLENPNNLGMFFVFAFFPFIVLTIKEKNLKNKIFYFLLTALSLANITFSYSRNALLGFTIGIVVLILLLGLKYIYLIFIPIFLLNCVPTVTNRIKDISDTSQNLSRMQIWKLAAYIIKDHPILGVGNGNYNIYLPDYLNVVGGINPTYIKVIHPHNAFIKAFSELGILGLFSFAGLILSSFVYVYKFIKSQRDNFYYWIYTGIFASLFSMLFMNLIDSFFNTPKAIVYYFILLGICEGIRLNKFNVNSNIKFCEEKSL